ncbi:MAG: hypothetical protein QW035_02540 [Candidatus Anstonellales archaeon]
MKVDPYLHAVLLLYGAGKEVNGESVAGVVKAAGIAPDEARIKVLTEALKGVNIEEALKESVVSPVAAAPSAAGAAPAEKKEEKKEEKKTEEEAAQGLAGLFG